VKGFNNQVTVPPTSWTNSLFFHKEKKAQFQVENIETIQNAPAVKF
jgi:LemA protein